MKKHDRLSSVKLKKYEADKRNIFPDCLILEDSGEWLTLYATTKSMENIEIMVERAAILKKYQ
jgi:hypothetical protein